MAEARNKTVQNPFTGRPDFIVDVTAAGNVTGTSMATTGLICSSTQSLGTDSGGNFICVSGSGSGTVTSISQGTGMNFSVNPITATGTINLTTPVTVSNGGTGDTTLTSNGVLYGNGTGAISVTAQGGSNTVLTASAGAPSFSSSPTVTSLTANNTVTGVTLDISGQAKFGQLTVANAYLNVGTGSVVTGTTILNCADTSGQHLNYNSTTNAWSCGTSSSGGGTNHNFLSSTHTDTVTASPTRGDLVVANTTPSWARFAVGASNTVLSANGTDPSWVASPTVTNLTATNTVTGTAVLDTPNLENSSATNNGVIIVRDSLLSYNTVTGTAVDTLFLENSSTGVNGNVVVRDSLTSANTVTGTLVVDTPSLENSSSTNGGIVLIRDSLSSANTVTGIVVDTVFLQNSSPSQSGNVVMWDNLTSPYTITGTTVAATTLLLVPYGVNPTVGGSGGVAQDTTDNQLLVGASSVYPDKYQECHTYENLVASDDNMNIMNDRKGVTVTDASCYTTGSFTTQPTLSFQNDAAGAITGTPTCTGTSPPTWATLSGANATLTSGQGLQFNTTNTPAPTFGTQTIICVAYRKTRQ